MSATPADPAVTGGNYEVIRARLIASGRELVRRADALNEQRKARFGGVELGVVANTRIRTEAACRPRAIVQVAGQLLCGFHVETFRRKVEPADVFAVQQLTQTPEGLDFEPAPAESAAYLRDRAFVREFEQLFEYYKGARLLHLRRTEQGRLLAVFQVGATHKDIKVFRWSLDPQGVPTYVDDRGERDYTSPAQVPFDWRSPPRESFISGRHPHVSILDQVFIETVGGDLTVKVENNTEDGQGIWSEPVEDPRQSLDDASYLYAQLGPLILLKVLPFREKVWRHLVFNTITRTVARIDAIGQSAVALDDGHGIIFPKGYYLRSGEYKLFDFDAEGLELKRVVRAPNGEDVLYAFRRPSDNHMVLFPYNKVRQEVKSPIQAHGWTLFDDGKLVVFRATSEEPARIHPLQIWQTPFVSDLHYASQPTDASLMSRIGNAELVRGLGEAYGLQRLIEGTEPTRAVYEDLARACVRSLDSTHWLGAAELGNLAEVVQEIRRTAELIIDEFEKVQALRRQAAEALGAAAREQERLLIDTKPGDWREVELYLRAMTTLRKHRGHLITLRELRFIDLARLEALERRSVEAFEEVSKSCVVFLLRGDAFGPMVRRLEELLGRCERTQKAHELRPLAGEVDSAAEGLNLLTEVIGALQVEDPAQRTQILEKVSEVFGQINRVRATLNARLKELQAREGRAEFSAQFKLLQQSVSNSLAAAETPERCDEELGRLMLLVEELEARFGEYEDFLPELAAKREEVYETLSARKQQLLDERQRRAGGLQGAANRILEGIGRRSRTFKAEDDLNAFYASDPMVLKLRQLVEQLRGLGDAVKADELEGRLKASRQDGLRTLRDRTELFEGGGELIRFGKHQFSVNTQALELTLVPRGEGMALHLSGTDFYEPVEDADFLHTRPYWEQLLPSETPEVYRGESLAFLLLQAADAGQGTFSTKELEDAARQEGGLLALVRRFAADRHDEGYERGIHDQDAALILEKLLALRSTAGLLRFPAALRAQAALFWAFGVDKERKERWARRARSLGRLREQFRQSPALEALAVELGEHIATFALEHRLIPTAPNAADRQLTGAYLCEELAQDRPQLVLSAAAESVVEGFWRRLDERNARAAFEDDLRALEKDLRERAALARAWVQAAAEPNTDLGTLEEAVARVLCVRALDWQPTHALAEVAVTGLLGKHPRIQERVLNLRLDELLARLTHHVQVKIPGFVRYREQRHALLERHRKRLRLSEFAPRVMSSFVRNQLIQQVYLPLVGDNLAKQMGAAGAGRRTDQMGLLLLVSPPGYGKTTLMEYVANRLGLVFVKVNGPALGHSVHSLDPAEAPNATARQEVEKINLAFEMGNNVMLYLDDIQHTHPELLQKFISLCDAQRRVEGVWGGRTRTYDLRGKKFCVVMAGNPYTETGEKFRIPDMLANRADTYNLGDVLQGKEDVFALSFIENALTSNSALAPLAGRDPQDVLRLVRMAQGGEVNPGELSTPLSAVEVAEVVAVLQRLFKVQQVVLQVNQQYVLSAAQEDSFRQEPPFKLQGSYRNMNKMAEKVVAALNDEELERLIDDHYLGESQTLTTGAEQNLLKLGELRGRLNPEQAERWGHICKEFRRLKALGGKEEDPVTRLTGSLGLLARHLEGIEERLDTPLAPELRALGEGLGAIQAALGASPAGPELRALGERLGGIEAALGASPAGPELRALGVQLGGVVSALTDTQAHTVMRGLAVQLHGIRKALAQQAQQAQRGAAAPLHPPGGGQEPGGARPDPGSLARLDTLVHQLDQLTRAVREAPVALAEALPSPVAAGDPLAAAFAAANVPSTAGERARVRKELLGQAQRALRGEPAPADLAQRGVVMASALSVVQDLVARLGELSASYLPEEQRRAFLDDLRRHVALSLAQMGEGSNTP